MGHCYRQLDDAERQTIYKLLGRKIPLTQIAKIVGRHHSTLYRELSRNYFHDREYPQYSGWFSRNATESARKRRYKRRKLERDRELRLHVIEKLEQHWSPEQIAGRLKLCPVDKSRFGRVCSETIYRFVYDRNNREMALYTLLARRRKIRRGIRGRKPRGSHIPLYCNIKHRPEDIAKRDSFGHWEGDLIIFKREHGKKNLTSLVERKTRFQILLANRDRKAGDVMSKIAERLSPLPPHGRQTMTFDRGTEFMAWRVLHQATGMKSYFCDVSSSWQKGSVENSNGRVRRYLPLEANLDRLSCADILAVEEAMNTTPRKCLGFQTPKEAFERQLRQLQ